VSSPARRTGPLARRTTERTPAVPGSQGAAQFGAADSGIGTSAWRALAVFRALTLVYAIVVNLAELSSYPGKVWCLATLGVMVAWSALVTYLYTQPRWCRWWVLAADMAVTVLMVLATLLVKSEEQLAAGQLTVPTVWAATAALAWALRWKLAGSLWGAAVIAAANVAVDRGQPTFATIHSLVLLLLAAVVIGYVMVLAERAEATLGEAIRLKAATAERERLSREIHDGVLQVLAMIRRNGSVPSSGGPELSRLAAEQEAALRTLVSAGPPTEHHGGLADLRELLARAGNSPSVQLVTPADPVLLAAHAASELAAAVSAALHNVKHHVGPDAPAWVLVEDAAGEVIVTVRDDGPGFEPGRLDAAAQEGRLGVCQSIVGRVRDLGGVATITSAPGEGTEVELRVPR
jgi:signal transduction histidine kinase